MRARYHCGISVRLSVQCRYISYRKKCKGHRHQKTGNGDIALIHSSKTVLFKLTVTVTEMAK